jgi:ribosomal protein S18 acetylase RimI-like enzyme
VEDYKLIIRRPTKSDILGLCRLDDAVFEHNKWKAEEFYEQLNGDYGCFVVDELYTDYKNHTESKLVGYLTYSLETTNSLVCTIDSLGIDPNYRRMRLATELLQTLENEATFSNVSKITLNIDSENLPMQLFLKHMGYKCLEIEKYSDKYDPPRDVFIFEKTLQVLSMFPVVA